VVLSSGRHVVRRRDVIDVDPHRHSNSERRQTSRPFHRAALQMRACHQSQDRKIARCRSPGVPSFPRADEVIEYPDQRTSSDRLGWSGSCHFRTHALRQKHPSRSRRACFTPRTTPREPARRQSAGKQRRPCREATAAVLRRGSPFRDHSSVCRALGNWNSGGRGTPYGVTHTHFAIVSRSASVSKSRRYCKHNIRLAVASFWSFVC
jgi:hypothetical protein